MPQGRVFDKGFTQAFSSLSRNPGLVLKLSRSLGRGICQLHHPFERPSVRCKVPNFLLDPTGHWLTIKWKVVLTGCGFVLLCLSSSVGQLLFLVLAPLGPALSSTSSARSGGSKPPPKAKQSCFSWHLLPATVARVNTETLVLAGGRKQEHVPSLFWIFLLLSHKYITCLKFQRQKPRPINVNCKIYIASSRTKISLYEEWRGVKWVAEDGRKTLKWIHTRT